MGRGWCAYSVSLSQFRGLVSGLPTKRARVAPKTAMELMRHSDINLTLKRYSHVLLPERASAIAELPDPSTDTGNSYRPPPLTCGVLGEFPPPYATAAADDQGGHRQ